jgi:predicted nuclease of restriction endonuclease-like (RecB) superfamily
MNNISVNAEYNAEFSEVVQLIHQSRERAYKAVNTELMELYWQVGKYISIKISESGWGDGVVEQLADFIAKTQPGIRGFARANLFRMRQFYDAYCNNEIVSPLVRQLPWTHNVIILSQAKTGEERDFYIRQAVKEGWSKRVLERQFKSSLFERTVLSPVKASQELTKKYPDAPSIFKDAYMVEFLDLPDAHSEADLHSALLYKLKDFLVEIGRDFCFIGTEYPVQVGGRDFSLDLLFFHRGLNCLVAFELKVGRFEPEYLGKLSFYLEAVIHHPNRTIS